MSDIKKLLTIFNESTTAGSVAVGAGRGKLPADTIFAAEDSDCSSIEMPNSPANFDLWKNSKLIGKQQNSHKKVAVNKTTMYPQLAEGTHPEQEKINNTKRSRLSRERNAGLNEPDEVPSSDVKRDFGTWYFTYQDGSIVIKDGRPLLASSTQGVRDVIAIAKKHGIDVRSHEGAPPKLSESGYKTPKDMDDYTDDDWAEWDAKVGSVGEKAKKKDNLDWHYNNIMGTKGLSDKAKKQTTDIYNKLKENEGVAEGIMNKIANKVMGAAPEQPKYKVGQRVKYETSPDQPDWKDGGRGVGVITAYKNGHYMINGNPVNHFEIKGVVDQGVAEAGNKPIDKQFPLGTGDTRTPRDIKSQMRGASDRFVQQTAASKPGPFRSKVAKMQNKMANSELRKRSDHDRMATGTNEGQELSEEMIADRLKNELALFKKGSKAKDKDLGSKPKSKEVQPKKSKESKDEDK